MSNTKNLANLAAALDDGTSGQVLQSTGSGGVQFSDSTGSGVTVHANQAAMLTDAASASEGSLHYETGTNKLYVKQSSGFYLLASITNVAPTIDSFSEATGGASANNLTAGGTFTLTSGSNTVVTINATEPDLETISYSATVTSGTATDVFSSPSFPVTNQSSNVFTLTPLTSGSGGTVTIRFDASDGTNVANVSHSFEIAFVIADSRYTTLLMATDGSAGDNDTITYDTGSTTGNSFTSIATNHSAGTFSPYRHGGYSAYMGGNGNYISTPHATSLKPSGTDDFCVSLWYYPNAIPSTNTQVAGDFRVVSYPTNCNGWDLLHLTSNVLAVRWSYPNYADMNSGSTTLNIGEWNHIVYCKNDSTMSLFINGARVNTTTSNIGMTASTLGSLYIGWAGSSSGSTEHSINGYITDFKLDIGGNNAFDATATSITVPTERVIRGDNTKLFACHLPYLKDGSTSDHTLSFNGGNTSTKPFGPYDYSEYDESINGGSILIDAYNKLIQLDDSSSDFALGTTETTIKLWYYPMDADATTAQYLIRKGTNAAASGHWALGHYSSNRLRTMTRDNGGSWLATYSSNNVITPNTWNYIEWYQPTSGNGSVKVNGTEVISTSTSSNYGSITDTIRLPQTAQNPTNGLYYADFQFVKGDARESSVPTAPMSTDTNAKLHVTGQQGHVLDKSQMSTLKLEGGAAASTTQAKFSNTASVYFDGNGDYVTATAGDLGDGDFSVEYWVRYSSFYNYITTVSTTRGSTGWSAGTQASAQIVWYSSSAEKVRGSATMSTNTWHHVAFTRENGTMRGFLDGTQDGTSNSDTSNFSDTDLNIGRLQSGSEYTTGYVQDLRITKGLARHVNNSGTYTYPVPSVPLKG